MDNKYAIETIELTKSFGEKMAVSKANMHVKKGEIYGFVGPNGAGKSTILKMMLNLIQPDSGKIVLLGQKVYDDNYKIRTYVGSIIENPYFYEKLSGFENLELHGSYMGIEDTLKIEDILDLVSLSDAKNKAVSQYSLGMKQRLAIGRAILGSPQLLILDEPINALDPEGIVEMRNLFKMLSQKSGVTILISSHILTEIELIADTIGIIKNGHILEEIPIKEIGKYQEDFIEVVVDDMEKTTLLFKDKGIPYTTHRLNHITISDNHLSEIDVSSLLIKNDIGLLSISRNRKSLEDHFFRTIADE